MESHVRTAEHTQVSARRDYFTFHLVCASELIGTFTSRKRLGRPRSDEHAERTHLNHNLGKPEPVGSVIPTIKRREDTSKHGEKTDSGLLSQMKCYSCGPKGHRKADCPKRVAQVLIPHLEEDLMVSGKVGNMIATKMKVETGSQQTLVHPDFVQHDQYTGQAINIVAVGQHQERPPLAKVWLQVESTPSLMS